MVMTVLRGCIALGVECFEMIGKKMNPLVSKEDLDLLDQNNWFISGGYWRRNLKKKHKIREVLLHRVIITRILGRPIKEIERVDHIDRDKNNNQRFNLRIVTQSQNGMNRPAPSNNTSGYKGVVFVQRGNPWRAMIRFKGKRINIGSFKTKEEAAIAYNKKALELFGDRAYLNIIDSKNQ